MKTETAVAEVKNSSGYSEKDAQEYILSHIETVNGFERTLNSSISPKTGIDIQATCRFIMDTQIPVWEYFLQFKEPIKELEALIFEEKQKRGTLDLLQNGIPRKGNRPKIALMYGKSALNPDLNYQWEKNIFQIYDEVKYENIENPTKRIDIVSAVNGIPWFALELKNELTGQRRQHAEEQFKLTRSNIEPLLRPVTGCVFFASMSRRDVGVTTTLKGVETKFMPFNMGHENGKGNPPVDGNQISRGFRTHYMFTEILTKDCVTTLLLEFMFADSNLNDLRHLSVQELTEIQIYAPRYHQLRLVRSVIKELATTIKKKSMPRLAQHSPGSGKTLSISWLAHQIIKLVDFNSEEKTPKFDHVIVISDKINIVDQLNRSIKSLNKHDGLVAEVDNSKDLIKEIKAGKKILVTTVQKFGRLSKVLESISGVKEKNFMLIVDEAHSGQTGENAAGIVDVLGTSLADEAAEFQGEIGNISYIAFTATPKKETLIKFGDKGKPFDLYSMKQAIEEGYILNVLKNYIKYDVFNKIYNLGVDDELPSTIYARRRLNDYIRTSEVNLEHKVAIVLEHMLTSTLQNINGLGRGMLVVSSRIDVKKYFDEINRQIKECPELYSSIKPMAAYTGYLDIDGTRYEDKDLNGFMDKEIPSRLADENIASPYMRNLLIVADKFQTGFDEPLLCSMYLDKKVKGISAVQTLSRLNRIRFQGDKENVAVIDFEDNEEEITLAFEKYHVESKIKDYTTLLNLTQSAIAIYQHGFYSSTDIDEYYDAQLKSKSNAFSATTMSNIINKVLDMVELHQESSDEEVRDLFATFKNEISNYVEDFIFVSQFKQIVDPNLRGLFIFNKLLLNLIKGNKNTYGSQWLEDLSVEIEKTLVSEKNLSGLVDSGKSLDSGSRRGTNAVNPNIVDKPTTVDELINEYNEKLKVLILNLVGKTNYTAIDIEKFDFTVFAEIINEAGLNPQLNQIAKTISSQRFVNPSTVPIVSGIILKSLVNNKVKNKNNKDYINLVSLYNDQEEFRKRIQSYVLSSTYQLLLKNRTTALSGISELENNG